MTTCRLLDRGACGVLDWGDRALGMAETSFEFEAAATCRLNDHRKICLQDFCTVLAGMMIANS